MEYVQERVTTLHGFANPEPDAPVDRAAVVVPITEREHANLAAEHVLETLSAVDPARVVVPLSAAPERVAATAAWLEGFDADVEVVWGDGPRVGDLLADAGLDGGRGKGRDVWLGLGVAAKARYVVVHDADASTYSPADVPRLLFPLASGFSFAKGYYARVEDDRLYGRLNRLLYVPLVRALRAANDAPILAYLDAFRYGLAGEFAATGELASQLRVERGWGLEVGTLGDAFAAVGAEGTAQVDLGRHEHDHRSVHGPEGLGDMADDVAAALLRVAEEGGVDPDYDTLTDRYRDVAERLLDQYAVDAAFNRLDYDRAAEHDQVERYASSVAPPGRRPDSRLPRWVDAPIAAREVLEATRADLAAAREGARP